MSAHDISEHVRAPASEPRPSAGVLSIAGYVAFAHVANATFGRQLFPIWALK